MLIEIEGDLLESDAKYICHQCNCTSIGSAGLAREIFKKYPYADAYWRGCDRIPGEISVMGNGENQRYIINMYAQIRPGCSSLYVLKQSDGANDRIKYFISCLQKIKQIENLESIAFPFGIGCNLAGGDWSKYYKILKKFAESIPEVKVYIISLKKPDYKEIAEIQNKLALTSNDPNLRLTTSFSFNFEQWEYDYAQWINSANSYQSIGMRLLNMQPLSESQGIVYYMDNNNDR